MFLGAYLLRGNGHNEWYFIVLIVDTTTGWHYFQRQVTRNYFPLKGFCISLGEIHSHSGLVRSLSLTFISVITKSCPASYGQRWKKITYLNLFLKDEIRTIGFEKCKSAYFWSLRWFKSPNVFLKVTIF